jgi:hypothetical protein
MSRAWIGSVAMPVSTMPLAWEIRTGQWPDRIGAIRPFFRRRVRTTEAEARAALELSRRGVRDLANFNSTPLPPPRTISIKKRKDEQ